MGEEGSGEQGAVAKAVGARIRELRERSGLTQQDFAKAAGMKRQYANRVELGLQNLSLRTLSRIALSLDTSMSSLLEGIEADEGDVGPRPWIRKSDVSAVQ